MFVINKINKTLQSKSSYIYTIAIALLCCLGSCEPNQSTNTNANMLLDSQTPNNTIRKVLAIALDADGCVFNMNYVDGCHRSCCPKKNIGSCSWVWDAQAQRHKAMLIQHNQKLLAHINRQIAKGGYDKILLLIASWRQDAAIDRANSCKGGYITALFFETMPILVDAIKQQHPSLSDKIVFDPYLITDTLEGVSPGTYYKEACKHYLNPDKPNAYISSDKMNKEINHIPSKGKRIIVEKHQQYLQAQFPAATIDYRVYDDYASLYQAYLAIIPPRGFDVEMLIYNGSEPKRYQPAKYTP